MNSAGASMNYLGPPFRWEEEYLGPELPKDQWWQDGTQMNADEGR